jgi:hypothetical protein
MRRYYFDLNDGGPARDRTGVDFATSADAIQHSRELAQKLRNDPSMSDPELQVLVINENGAEIHREAVFPMKLVPRPWRDDLAN